MKPLHIQFLQFSGVGVVGTLVHYSILVTLVHGLGAGAIEATSLGFIGGALTNYLLNYRYTFTSNKSHQEAMTKFFVVAFIGMLFNAVIMGICIDLLQLHYLLAQVIATSVVLSWNFAANHKWTFQEHGKNTDNALGE